MKTLHVVLVILVVLHFSNARIKKSRSKWSQKILAHPTVLEEFEKRYHAHKAQTILETIEILIDDMHLKNISLIGSQNVYESDGSLKEVRTVELSIPNDEIDEMIFEEIKPEAIEKVTARQLEGFNIELYSYQDEESSFNEELYMPNGLNVRRFDEGTIINQTIHVKDVNELENDYNSRKISLENTITSRLALDINGKIISSKSSVVPELFATVENGEGDAVSNILETSLNNFVTAVQEVEDLKDVPERIRSNLQDQYPEVLFTVSTNVIGSYYMKNDFSFEMVYDYAFAPESMKLTVYGYNTTKA